ncbi:MAG: PorT family protein [Bacteroidales bacterium]|nr:PorT family protein [Bacteroidales bacterium]
MKKLLTLMFFVALSLCVTAQVDYSFGNIKHKREKSTIPTIGIKGGLTSYHMHFAYEKYNKLSDDLILKPGFGLYVEFPIKKLKGFAVGGEVMMIDRGYRKSFKFRGDMPEVDQIQAHYLDVRIPITYYFRHTEVLNPYIFIAPDFGMCYGGEMTKTFAGNPKYNTSVDISKSDAMSSFDLSLAFGVGIRYKIHFQVFTLVLKLDGSYNLGLLNTNGAKEPVYVDNLAYHVKDASRYNRGLEVMFSIGIPLKFNFLHDSCWGW